MDGWIEGIQRAIDYMESHIDEDMDIRDIAACSHVSAFHFQRIFGVLCGITVGEYLRNRRLTLAAQALTKGETKVIDAAVRFGYDSPDSFARAFTRFHGISPSAATKKGAALQAYAPLHIKLSLEGGNMLEYRIAEKAAFTVMGVSRRFDMETSFAEIPKFWDEHKQSEAGKTICGMFGLCLDDGDGQDFTYMIADNYIPWDEIPDGCTTHTVPAGTWAIFPCKGALPDSLQSVNQRVWSEWLPNCKEYKLKGQYNVEMYDKPTEDPNDYYCEIWVPIEKM